MAKCTQCGEHAIEPPSRYAAITDTAGVFMYEPNRGTRLYFCTASCLSKYLREKDLLKIDQNKRRYLK